MLTVSLTTYSSKSMALYNPLKTFSLRSTNNIYCVTFCKKINT